MNALPNREDNNEIQGSRHERSGEFDERLIGSQVHLVPNERKHIAFLRQSPGVERELIGYDVVNPERPPRRPLGGRVLEIRDHGLGGDEQGVEDVLPEAARIYGLVVEVIGGNPASTAWVGPRFVLTHFRDERSPVHEPGFGEENGCSAASTLANDEGEFESSEAFFVGCAIR